MKTVRSKYSVLDYHPNPALPSEGRIPLGVVLEVVTPKWIIIGIRARSFLTPAETQTLDGIGREMLSSPIQFLKKEVESLLSEPRKPGEILSLLAKKHDWSVRVSSPKTREIKVLLSTTRDAVDRTLEELFGLALTGERKRSSTSRKTSPIAPSLWAESNLYEARYGAQV